LNLECDELPLNFAFKFNLRRYKTGEIRSWYPDNPVLRKLTPIGTCRPMEVGGRAGLFADHAPVHRDVGDTVS
jgi:hypothetical protein